MKESKPVINDEIQAIADKHRVLRMARPSTEGSIRDDLDYEIAVLAERAKSIAEESGETIRELLKAKQPVEHTRDTARQIRTKRMKLRQDEFTVTRRIRRFGMTKKAEEKLAQLHEAVNKIDNEQNQLETNPETALQLRMMELSEYRDQLNDRFAIAPSRQKLFDQIQELIQDGAPVFLKGPTGTGKTELAREFVRALYDGQEPEIVRGNPNVQQHTMFGSTGLRGTEAGATETTFDPAPVLRAIQRGVPVIVDEFNLIDPQVRFVFKELYNRKPGDKIDIPDNGKHVIKEGFAIIVTANLGARYEQNRFPLDDAEERVFLGSTIPVEYIPKEELYDLCLSSLATVAGRIPISVEDATDTLKRYCDAIAEIQRIYIHGTSAFDTEGGATRGIKQALEKTVIDPGLALKIVRSFPVKSLPKQKSFASHLGSEITKLLLTVNSDNDRNLLAKIFSNYRIITPDIGEFTSVSSTEKVLKEAGLPDSPRGNIMFRAAAILDPYNLRGASIDEDIDSIDSQFGFFENERGEKIRYRKISVTTKSGKLDPNKEFNGPDGKRYIYRGTTDAGDIIFDPISPESLPLNLAEQILGKDNVFGPVQIKEAFGIDVKAEDIPYSKKTLEIVKANDCMLIYRYPSLTAKAIAERLDAKMKQTDTTHKALFDTDWYKDEPFYTTDTPTKGWAIVSKEPIPSTLSKNYLGQTEILKDKIKEIYPDPNSMPPELKQAIEEYETQKPTIEPLMTNETWQQASDKLANLKLTQILRPSFSDTIWDIAITHTTSKDPKTKELLKSLYDWTKSRSSDGSLVDVGSADSDGANVRGWDPVNRNDLLGARLSAVLKH